MSCWRSEHDLWAHDLAVAPGQIHSTGVSNFGDALNKMGRAEEACRFSRNPPSSCRQIP